VNVGERPQTIACGLEKIFFNKAKIFPMNTKIFEIGYLSKYIHIS
jgi:hypothetical protein